MTGRSKGGSLGAALGNLRRERAGETSAAPAERPEVRVAFTSRLKPSQRRYLKRLASDWEEETGERTTVEDVLDAFVDELVESNKLRARLLARLRET